MNNRYEMHRILFKMQDECQRARTRGKYSYVRTVRTRRSVLDFVKMNRTDSVHVRDNTNKDYK